MAKDLTSSRIDGQNILNNDLALQEIQESSNIKGIIFEGKVCFTKNMVASFFNVEPRTVERYVSDERLNDITTMDLLSGGPFFRHFI